MAANGFQQEAVVRHDQSDVRTGPGSDLRNLVEKNCQIEKMRSYNEKPKKSKTSGMQPYHAPPFCFDVIKHTSAAFTHLSSYLSKALMKPRLSKGMRGMIAGTHILKPLGSRITDFYSIVPKFTVESI